MRSAPLPFSCRSTITLSRSQTPRKQEPTKPDPDRIYKVAARNLREYNGVPSMTPAKLTKTLTLLKLSPRRLVKQGLAPARLLHNVGKNADGKGPKAAETNDDAVETAAADMKLMSVEDDRKEWADGFVSVGDDEPTGSIQQATVVAEAVTSSSDESSPSSSSSSDTDTEKVPAANGGKPKNIIHAAFVNAGIQLRPREAMPLLLGLGVRPMRLVKLGLVDFHELRAMRIHDRRGGRGRAGGGVRGHGDWAAGPCGPAPGMRPCGGPRDGSRGFHHPPGPPGHHGGWGMFTGGPLRAMFGRPFGGPPRRGGPGSPSRGPPGKPPHRHHGAGHHGHPGPHHRHHERNMHGMHHHGPPPPPPPPPQHGRMGWAHGYGYGGCCGGDVERGEHYWG